MPFEYRIEIGGERTSVCRHLLGGVEAAFVLRTTRQRVSCRWTANLLPSTIVAGRRRIDASVLSARLVASEDWLAVEFLRAWCEGRFEAPVPRNPDEFPPDLADCLEYLERPCMSAVGPRAGNDTGFANRGSSVSLLGPEGVFNSTRLAEGCVE